MFQNASKLSIFVPYNGFEQRVMPDLIRHPGGKVLKLFWTPDYEVRDSQDRTPRLAGPNSETRRTELRGSQDRTPRLAGPNSEARSSERGDKCGLQPIKYQKIYDSLVVTQSEALPILFLATAPSPKQQPPLSPPRLL